MTKFGGITSRRTKRSWKDAATQFGGYIMEPLGKEFASWLFRGSESTQDMSLYDKQLADLNSANEETKNLVSKHITMFKVDSEGKINQIEQLKRARNEAEFKLKVINETMQEDNEEKERQIRDLQEFLRITNETLKEQQNILEKQANDIAVIQRFMTNMTSFTDYLENSIKENKQNIDKNKILIEINSLVSDFDFISNNYIREQNQLLHIVKDSNRGFLDPRVITPLRLIDLIKEAEAHLPEDCKFPYHPNIQNSMKLYRLIDPIIFRYNYTIVFTLRMKLVQENTLSLYKITSAPMMVEPGKYVFVLPKHPFLLIDKQEKEFTLMSEDRYKSCTILDDTEFVCSNVLVSTIPINANIGCETGIFLNNEISFRKCNIRVMYLKKPIFLQLQQERTWIYVAPKVTSLVIKSKDYRVNENIHNVGIISIGREQIAVVDNIVLKYFPYIDYTKVLIKFMPNISILNAIDKSKILDLTDEALQYRPAHNPILPFDYEELEEFSVSLRRIQGAIKSGLKEPEETNKMQYVIISLVVVGAIMSVVFILFKKDYLTCFKRISKS